MKKPIETAIETFGGLRDNSDYFVVESVALCKYSTWCHHEAYQKDMKVLESLFLGG